jgi:hypothetical protein
MTSQRIVNGLLEMNEKEFKRWDQAIAKLKELQVLRQQANDTMDELRFSLELRREMARHGRHYDEISGLMRAGHLRRNYPKAGEDDIVGAHLEDGSTVMFGAPIKAFKRTAPPVKKG